MTFPGHLLCPIPPLPHEDWDSVPPPAECGEALADPCLLSPRISYSGEYRRQGLPGAMDRPLLRENVARKLVRAAEALPAG